MLKKLLPRKIPAIDAFELLIAVVGLLVGYLIGAYTGNEVVRDDSEDMIADVRESPLQHHQEESVVEYGFGKRKRQDEQQHP